MSKKTQKSTKKSKKKLVALCIILAIVVAGGVTATMFLLNRKTEPEAGSTNNTSGAPAAPKYYSRLTGLEIANDNLNSSPIFCIQVPNGTDGARPHAGLEEAAIVYEAIAEAGITRFAAVFQNPENTAIGPIRSLRLYYLQWDTPLGCTVVHAGGADDAIAALRSGGYNEIDEGAFNWRDGSDYIAPNNLFTDAANLNSFAKQYGLEGTGDAAKVYPRLLPEEAKKIQAENQKAAEDTTDAEGNVIKSTTPLVTEVNINFGNFPDFNTHYSYNPATGLYARSYASGEKELSYDCTKEDPVMSRECNLVQIAPSAVVAMEVNEWLDDDNYHQVIEAIGSGTAYIFQNGSAIKGTWSKSSAGSQIVFQDANGAEISFTPGQLWISAIPRGVGSVDY
ncbi:DUF3048 domain-containing protein [Candidatus Saccharibacteria bacterium]|nr:DUF3048 domain-containing protein [Candidatus Saccharibacteria bacterium]